MVTPEADMPNNGIRARIAHGVSWSLAGAILSQTGSFLASLALGFIGRTMPQINVMQLGITAHLLVGMAMLMIGFAGWAYVSHGAWNDYFGGLRELLRK